MENCKKCGKDFEPQKGLKSYCSLACRNSRNHTNETKSKISKSILTSDKFWKSVENTKKWFDYKENGKKIQKTWNDRILAEDFENLSFGRLRKRIILEQNGKCNHCGISEWNGIPITLELEHIDGDNSNNSRDNLEAICPNCHSQTKTWRGKNKKNRRVKIADDDIVKAYLETDNIRQTLLKVGLSAKGGNYKRVHMIIKKYELN